MSITVIRAKTLEVIKVVMHLGPKQSTGRSKPKQRILCEPVNFSTNMAANMEGRRAQVSDLKKGFASRHAYPAGLTE